MRSLPLSVLMACFIALAPATRGLAQEGAPPPSSAEPTPEPVAPELTPEAMAPAAAGEEAPAQAAVPNAADTLQNEPAVVHEQPSTTPARPLYVDEPEPEPRPKRRSSRAARAELATVQTVVGAAMGLELCGMLACESGRAWAGSSLLGAGGGLALSMLTTRDGISAGRMGAVNGGALYGTWLGFGLAGSFARDGMSGQTVAALVIAGQLSGVGIGLLADNAFILSAGEASLASSAGLWTGLASILALGAIDPDDPAETVFPRFLGTTLATTTLAMVGGGWLARHDHVSRGRALMVDVGAIAGAGLFPLAAWLIGGNVGSTGMLWSSFAGTLAGVATAYALTSTWDLPDDGPALSMSLAPTQGGGLAQLSMRM